MATEDEGPDPIETLDDGEDRELTMAQIKSRLEIRRQAAAEQKPSDPAELPRNARPRERDGELLADPPMTNENLGALAGWRAGRNARLVLLGAFGLVVLTVAILSWQAAERREYDRLHPLPEVEATISPDTPRDMTLSDGQFRLGLGREAPAINVVHLPDRDITLAEGEDKAQFKVEVAGGKTVKITVLTGDIVERLHEGAAPLL